MIALLTAALLQASAPVEAECAVLTQTRRQMRAAPPISVQIDCPDDVVAADDLQRLANDISQGLNLRFRNRGGFFPADTVSFGFSEGNGWRARPGQILVRNVPPLPQRVMSDGWGFGCVYPVAPDIRGRVDDPEMTCFVTGDAGRSAERIAANTTRDAAENSLWLPVTGTACSTSSLIMNTSGSAAVGDSTLGALMDDVTACPVEE